jgi:hypothetical protein
MNQVRITKATRVRRTEDVSELLTPAGRRLPW